MTDEPMPSEVGYGPVPQTTRPTIRQNPDGPWPTAVGITGPVEWIPTSPRLVAAREQRDRDEDLRAIVRDLAASRPWAETPTGWTMCGLCGCEIAYPEGPRPDEHEPDCTWRRAREATT